MPVTPPLSSVKVSVAVLEPTAVGVNVTLQVQVPFVCATVAPLMQVVVPGTMAKSPGFVPVIATVARCSADVPVLLSVPLTGALVVLSVCGGVNVTVVTGERRTRAVPVPVSAIDCVEPATALLSSVKVSDAVRVPLAVGLNFTLHVQFALTATVTAVGKPVSQLVPAATMEKSETLAPVTATAVMCRTSVPVVIVKHATLCRARTVDFRIRKRA